MSIYGSARVRRVTASELVESEAHGRREDASAKRRKVREAASLTWQPEGRTGDALALSDRLADHVKGAFVPKGGDAVALHVLVKLPESVPTGTDAEADQAMRLAVRFAQHVWGGNAVFSARMDRDERSTSNVDLFLAPRYAKVTKRSSKDAISMSRHLKELAGKHGRPTTLRGQGQALQDELASWLTGQGYEATRGKPKQGMDPDWVFPEAVAAGADRHEAEKARQEARQEREAAKAARLDVGAREAALRASQTAHQRDVIRVEAVKRGLDARARQLATAEAGVAAERSRLATIAAELDALLEPVRAMVGRWTTATGIVRQAIGAKGPAAVTIAESDDVGRLASIRDRLKGVGR